MIHVQRDSQSQPETPIYPDKPIEAVESGKAPRQVRFDTISNGKETRSYTPSYTLKFRHQAYRCNRPSRTFMIAVGKHATSDYVVRWLLDNLVDDGNEILCVHVAEQNLFGQ